MQKVATGEGNGKHGGGRPRKGSLVWCKSGWRARVTVTIDGEQVQKTFPLGTLDRAVARRKLAKLVAEGAALDAKAAEAAAAPETVASYAAGWLAHREAIGLRTAKGERHWLTAYWLPVLGSRRLVDLGQLALVEQALVPLARSVLDERAQPAAGRRARSRRNLAAEAEGGAAAPAAPVPPAPALEAKLGELAKGLEALQSRLDAAGPGPGVPRFDVELGLASESNLYVPPGGGDLLRDGGLFVATYGKTPRAGTEVVLAVVFPTGAAHELRGTVAFVREASLAAEPGKPPGFGVKLAALSSAARQQIAAYVAERAPGQG